MAFVKAARNVYICLRLKTGKSLRYWPRTPSGWETPGGAVQPVSLSDTSNFLSYVYSCCIYFSKLGPRIRTGRLIGLSLTIKESSLACYHVRYYYVIRAPGQ